jgi:ketosteroid isomerase-like protein
MRECSYVQFRWRVRADRLSSLAPAHWVGDHSAGVPDRKELVRQAFTALDGDDLAPFQDLFDPDAKWIGVPQRGEKDETPTCTNRAAIVDQLERHHKNGRRFQLGNLIEDGDRVAVEVTVLVPGGLGR